MKYSIKIPRIYVVWCLCHYVVGVETIYSKKGIGNISVNELLFHIFVPQKTHICIMLASDYSEGINKAVYHFTSVSFCTDT